MQARLGITSAVALATGALLCLGTGALAADDGHQGAKAPTQASGERDVPGRAVDPSRTDHSNGVGNNCDPGHGRGNQVKYPSQDGDQPTACTRKHSGANRGAEAVESGSDMDVDSEDVDTEDLDREDATAPAGGTVAPAARTSAPATGTVAPAAASSAPATGASAPAGGTVAPAAGGTVLGETASAANSPAAPAGGSTAPALRANAASGSVLASETSAASGAGALGAVLASTGYPLALLLGGLLLAVAGALIVLRHRSANVL